MSRIYFHAEGGRSELAGAERAHMAVLVTDVLRLSLRTTSFWMEQDKWNILVPNNYFKSAEDAGCYLNGAFENAGLRGPRGAVSCWNAAANTAIAMGGDPLRLAARIHAQCEVHGWVAAEDREWMADIIEEGRETKIFRGKIGKSVRWDVGWGDVETFLRTGPSGPVVMSYSVCDQFPNSSTTKDAGPEDEAEREVWSDCWSDRPRAQRWADGMEWLKQEPLLRLQPATETDGRWSTFRFGGGETGFELDQWALDQCA